MPLRTTSAACAGGGARAVRMVAPRRCVALRRGSIARVVRRVCVCGHRRRDASGKPASRHDRARIRASVHPRFACATAAGNGGDAAQTPFLAAPPRRAGGIATASLV
ncbi:hypothetical protein BMA10399_G0680 [Burkholderia mallei ATCC 10399]|nr:hypothetical protein BMA10399_G0680 [Burkholderia mallei ATCC 10399]